MEDFKGYFEVIVILDFQVAHYPLSKVQALHRLRSLVVKNEMLVYVFTSQTLHILDPHSHENSLAQVDQVLKLGVVTH